MNSRASVTKHVSFLQYNDRRAEVWSLDRLLVRYPLYLTQAFFSVVAGLDPPGARARTKPLELP